MINEIRIKYFPRLRKRLLVKYRIDYNRRNYYIIEKNFVPIFFAKEEEEEEYLTKTFKLVERH